MVGFSVRGRRAGRIAFGWVLIAGAGVLVARILGPGRSHAALVLAGSWAAALVAYAVVGALASRKPLSHAGELARPGLVVPSIGAALLLPLTLHASLLLALGIGAGFDDWVLYSLVGTGATHLVFAGLAGVRACALADGVPALSPWRIFGACVAVACVPFVSLLVPAGALAFIVPPVIVAFTGIPLVALMLSTEALAARERALAEACAYDLPRATARVRAESE